MTVKDLISEMRASLAGAGFESPELEASILVADSLGVPNVELPLQRVRRLRTDEEARIRASFARRMAHEPLQYIFGAAYFRSLKVQVGPGCLIPRPETELLAGFAIDLAPRFGMVCELGAGSGALGLSIATERPDLRVFASELSPEAFKWADLNRASLGASNFELRAGDLFSPFEGMRFDMVVANLPYIPAGDMATLQPEVRLCEPSMALDGGSDGLDAIRRAIADAPRFMKPGALLALEMAETHGEELFKLLCEMGSYEKCEIRKDLCGKDRFAFAVLASR